MALSAIINRSIRINGGTAIGTTNQAISAGANCSISETIAAAASNLEVAFVLDASQVSALVLIATADMTVETNDGTTPDNTFTLKANVPYVWTSADGGTLRDTAGVSVVDITALFVTSTAGGVLSVEALFDPTV
jgi:hypothetical protein